MSTSIAEYEIECWLDTFWTPCIAPNNERLQATALPPHIRATEKTKQPAIIVLSDRCEAAIREALAETTIKQTRFHNARRKPYSEATLRRYFAIAKKIAGIKRRCRFNDLRHTFASNLVSEGTDLTIVRDALGHTTCRMSERYAKPKVKDSRSCVKR